MRYRLNEVAASFWAASRVFVGALAPRLWILSNTFWSIGFVALIAVHSPSMLTDPLMVQSIAWSVALMMGTSNMFWLVGHALVDARDIGLLQAHLSSGGSLWGFVAGKAMVVGLYNLLSLNLAVAVTTTLFGTLPAITNPASWSLGFLLLQLASSGISAGYATLLIWLKRPWIATNFMQWLLPISSGMIPYPMAPQPLKLIMLFSPLSYPFELLRRGATGTAFLPLGGDGLITLSLVATLALLLAGLLALEWGERKMVRKGI